MKNKNWRNLNNLIKMYETSLTSELLLFYTKYWWISYDLRNALIKTSKVWI